jgi:PAS domain S-box-containing protein
MSVSHDEHRAVPPPGWEEALESSREQVQVRLPDFDQATIDGLRDYWEVYEKHYQELRVILMAELADDPDIGELIRTTPKEIQDEQARISHEMTRRAIVEGDWKSYAENIRSQGITYGSMGLTFAAWFRVVSAYRPHMVRFLLAAFATDTQRLLRSMASMDRMIDYLMSVIGDAYLEAKEEVIARQREAMGELRMRSRYQTVLSSIADGVITTDPHGNVITMNPAMEKLLGVLEVDAVGRRYDEVAPARAGERPLVWEERHLARAIAERQEVSSEGEDIWLTRPDGSEVPVSVTAAPIVAEGGAVLGGVNVIRERNPQDNH